MKTPHAGNALRASTATRARIGTTTVLEAQNARHHGSCAHVRAARSLGAIVGALALAALPVCWIAMSRQATDVVTLSAAGDVTITTTETATTTTTETVSPNPVTETATVPVTETATVPVTQTATALRTQTATAHTTKTRAVALPGVTTYRTLPGGVIVRE